jgi:hypothetical protein
MRKPCSSLAKKKSNQTYRRKLKRECFAHYGGDYFLTCTVETLDGYELHHPNGDGNKDRAALMGGGLRSPGGWKFYLKLRKLGWPSGYEVISTEAHEKLHGRCKAY